LPFESIVHWAQLLILHKEYLLAEQLLKEYISGSTHLVDPKPGQMNQQEGALPLVENLPPWMRPENQSQKATGSQGLSSSQYFYLVELLAFRIALPLDGYSGAFSKLKQMPLPEAVKDQFYKALARQRNLVAADVKISGGLPLEFKKEPAEEPEQARQIEAPVKVPDFSQRVRQRVVAVKRRALKGILYLGIIIFVWSGHKKGLFGAILQTRLFKYLAKVLFNI
jgi:hypothetical protein